MSWWWARLCSLADALRSRPQGGGAQGEPRGALQGGPRGEAHRPWGKYAANNGGKLATRNETHLYLWWFFIFFIYFLGKYISKKGSHAETEGGSYNQTESC